MQNLLGNNTCFVCGSTETIVGDDRRARCFNHRAAYPTLPFDAATMDRFAYDASGEPIIDLDDPNTAIMLLIAGKLQICGRGGRWYDMRKNGQVKTWKRSKRIEVPVKIGLYECFRLEWNTDSYLGCRVGQTPFSIRVRPDTFNSKTRT